MKRTIQPKFALALRGLRRARGLAQEEFDQISGRTYVSALERGLKQPTLTKVCELSAVMDLHPLTVLTLSFCDQLSADEAKKLLSRVQGEIDVVSLGFNPDISK